MMLKFGKVFLVFRIQSFLKIQSLASEINSCHLSLFHWDYNYFQIKILRNLKLTQEIKFASIIASLSEIWPDSANTKWWNVQCNTINYQNDEKTKSKRVLHAHQLFRKKIRKMRMKILKEKNSSNEKKYETKWNKMKCGIQLFVTQINIKQHRAHPVLEARKLLTYNLITVQGK